MRGLICLLLALYGYVLLARVLLSWFPHLPDGLRPVVELIYAVTEPVIRVARPLIPPVRIGAVALDLSILVVFFVLQLVQTAIC
ncbi:MAG: YggT family protein [Actinomycetota bacterium]